MSLKVQVAELEGSLPPTWYCWDPDTEILAARWDGGEPEQQPGAIELVGDGGEIVMLTVSSGVIAGLDIVAWPEREVCSFPGLPQPSGDGRILMAPDSPAESPAIEMETELSVRMSSQPAIVRLGIGGSQSAKTLRVSEHVLVELDQDSEITAVWLTDLPELT